MPATAVRPVTRRAVQATISWWHEPVPEGRVAAFRTVVYLFVIADLLYFTPWVRSHASLPGELYQPLAVGRLLPLPLPTSGLVHGIFLALLVTSLLAATGRFPRLLGWAVFALYFEWMIIAMSYGKVDHDRIAFLVALAVLPAAGRARHGSRTLTDLAGWAMRMVQLAVIATYFLAGLAKLQYGTDWLLGATLARAVLRRGTWYSDWLLDIPELLLFGQFAILTFELVTPVVFVVRPALRYWLIGLLYSFHLITYLSLEIAFWPHIVAMLCFLPLERVRPLGRPWAAIAASWRTRRHGAYGRRYGKRHEPSPAPAERPQRLESG